MTVTILGGLSTSGCTTRRVATALIAGRLVGVRLGNEGLRAIDLRSRGVVAGGAAGLDKVRMGVRGLVGVVS